jgi:hypothetical protein
MKFIENHIIDWYDNILKAFAKSDNGATYYCCLLAFNPETENKVYLCIDVKFLKGSEQLSQIIDAGSFKEFYHKLSGMIRTKRKNNCYLIKTKELFNSEVQLINYRSNLSWPKRILWGEYPYLLEDAEKIDNWWFY